MTQFTTRIPVLDDFLSSGLISQNYLNSLNKGMDFDIQKAFDIQSTYPYNVKSVIKDGTLQKVVLEYALAGFDKSEISVKVVDDKLAISAKKTTAAAEDGITTEYQHRGIAGRELSCKFTMGSKLDRKNVRSSFKNGMLSIEIPLREDEQTLVEITD